MKRTQQRPGPPSPGQREANPAWPIERHSGEGSASALETLQKIERRRVSSQPADPRPDDPPPDESAP